MDQTTELTRLRNSKLPRLRISRLRLGVAPFLGVATISAQLAAGAYRMGTRWNMVGGIACFGQEHKRLDLDSWVAGWPI